MPPKKKATKKSRPIHSKRNQSKKAKLHKALVPILDSKNLPATQGMLTLVQKQFKSDLMSLDRKTQARFDKIDGSLAQLYSKSDRADDHFAKIDARFAQVDARFDRIDARFTQIDARFAQVDARFDKIDARFTQIDAKFVEIDSRFDKIDANFVKIDKKFDQIDIKFEKIDVEFANVRSQFSEIHSALAVMTSEISKISIFIERQDSRNRFALEGYEQVYSRQDRFEHQVNQRIQAVEEVIAAIPKIAPDPT
ncbi:MAG: hypothetical protein IPK04_06335 [Bdellovibrionales bacterium]|nr:hypothetical protein [Bdellovibrionales bacterium]